MNFTSPSFILYFLPFLFLIYFISPGKIRNLVLIAASGIFYFWGEGSYLFYLYIWVVINYISSLLIYKSQKYAGFWLTIAIFINLGILIYFKYTNFLLANLNQLGLFSLNQLQIYLPLALSFFAFHAISYNIDTYRKIVKPEFSLSRIILYFTFFPHLIAGPIIRYHQIKEQLAKRNIDSSMIAEGIIRFVIGLSKKVIIADTLAPIADEIFGLGPTHLSFDQAWLGVICFGLQIYYDFSGYTDMAIGLGLMFGFRFPENFNYPYISTSITEFWRRWHITLSEWLKDYLYFPLARKWGKASRVKLYLSLLITFLLIGLWHGANWTYVVFGAIQAVALIVERIKNGILVNWMPKIIKHLYFLLIIAVSWVFFRSASLSEGFEFIRLILANNVNYQDIYYSTNYFLRNDIILVLIIGIIFATPLPKKVFTFINNLLVNEKSGLNSFNKIAVNILKLSAFVFLFLLSLMFVASETYKSFIYFRF